MDSMEDENIKKEEVCRTCLTDDGHFFNISDIFDHYTLTQMIQNITNLQINSSDGYTQSICFKCVKEVRRANKFRIKCLESNDALGKVQTEPVEVLQNVIDSPKVEKIKQELEESCDTADCFVETEYDCKSEALAVGNYYDNENSCIETNKRDKNNKTIIFDCPLCHGLFCSNNIYEKHIKDLHPDRLKDECFNKKREPLGFILKKACLKKIKCTYKCVFDEFSAKSFVEFKNHMSEHTGEKSVICVDCGFRTTKISLLKTHRLQKHVDEKKFSCTHCNYSCKTRRALKCHSAIHTKEKNYKCKLCPLTFKYASTLSSHKKVVHEQRKNHICTVCDKAFFKSTGLKDHMRRHTGERPFVCHYCGKRFLRADNMKIHVAFRHEPIKTLFKCDMCDYTTKTKFRLKIHIMKHNGEKPFKCPECPFSSSQNYMLKLHILRHTGEKLFPCDMCDYKGYTTDCVKRHRIIHTGEKSFACDICDYRGKTNKLLKRHLQTHSTEQNFECPNCPYKTNVRDILSKHIRRNCVIVKRGRRPSKLPNMSDNILINHEIKEDSEECFSALSNYV